MNSHFDWREPSTRTEKSIGTCDYRHSAVTTVFDDVKFASPYWFDPDAGAVIVKAGNTRLLAFGLDTIISGSDVGFSAIGSAASEVASGAVKNAANAFRIELLVFTLSLWLLRSRSPVRPWNGGAARFDHSFGVSKISANVAIIAGSFAVPVGGLNAGSASVFYSGNPDALIAANAGKGGRLLITFSRLIKCLGYQILSGKRPQQSTP
jgi:hypothetical protein